MTNFCGIGKTIERLLIPSTMEALLQAMVEIDLAHKVNAPAAVLLSKLDQYDECIRDLRIRVNDVIMRQLAVKP
jgi:hypothetical protein